MTREDIMGAVARGWCAPANTSKEMDSDLAIAISEEIWNLLNESTPVTVYWDDETGRTREVRRVCIRCIPDGRIPLLPMVVSPAGAAHEAERGDTTDCGKDCTGPDWWIRL